MSGGDFFGLLLHVASLIVYGGATLAIVALVIPAARAVEDPTIRRTVLARALYIYDPLAIAALGVLVMSGATNLTSYKAALRVGFFQKMGWLLVWKLGLAFLVVMAGTYITFGIGHRIVRDEGFGEPVDPKWLESMMRRLNGACIASLVLLLVTMWLGMELGHPATPTPAPAAVAAP